MEFTTAKGLHALRKFDDNAVEHIAKSLNTKFNKGVISEESCEKAFNQLDTLISKSGNSKYTKRTGAPGNYSYEYGTPNAKRAANKKDVASQSLKEKTDEAKYEAVIKKIEANPESWPEGALKDAKEDLRVLRKQNARMDEHRAGGDARARKRALRKELKQHLNKVYDSGVTGQTIKITKVDVLNTTMQLGGVDAKTIKVPNKEALSRIKSAVTASETERNIKMAMLGGAEEAPLRELAKLAEKNKLSKAESLAILNGEEDMFYKAQPIGTVNKHGKIKTAEGWVYQKKGQRANGGKVKKVESKFGQKKGVTFKEILEDRSEGGARSIVDSIEEYVGDLRDQPERKEHMSGLRSKVAELKEMTGYKYDISEQEAAYEGTKAATEAPQKKEEAGAAGGEPHITLNIKSKDAYNEMISVLQGMNVNHRRETKTTIRVYTSAANNFPTDKAAIRHIKYNKYVDSVDESIDGEVNKSESLAILEGTEEEFYKAAAIGTVNKYGKIKTANGWEYQKKGRKGTTVGSGAPKDKPKAKAKKDIGPKTKFDVGAMVELNSAGSILIGNAMVDGHKMRVLRTVDSGLTSQPKFLEVVDEDENVHEINPAHVKMVGEKDQPTPTSTTPKPKRKKFTTIAERILGEANERKEKEAAAKKAKERAKPKKKKKGTTGYENYDVEKEAKFQVEASAIREREVKKLLPEGERYYAHEDHLNPKRTTYVGDKEASRIKGLFKKIGNTPGHDTDLPKDLGLTNTNFKKHKLDMGDMRGIAKEGRSHRQTPERINRKVKTAAALMSKPKVTAELKRIEKYAESKGLTVTINAMTSNSNSGDSGNLHVSFYEKDWKRSGTSRQFGTVITFDKAGNYEYMDLNDKLESGRPGEWNPNADVDNYKALKAYSEAMNPDHISDGGKEIKPYVSPETFSVELREPSEDGDDYSENHYDFETKAEAMKFANKHAGQVHSVLHYEEGQNSDPRDLW